MAIERTLSILKPDALQSGVIGKILSRFEDAGLKPVAMKMLQLTQQQAEGFYAVHRERPFFRGLVQYMTSGPVIVQVLEGENAVARNRDVMGATNPANAAEASKRIYKGQCPVLLIFTGTISSARPGEFTYAWKRSDGVVSAPRTVQASRAGESWRVREVWEVSGSTRGWAQLWIASEQRGSQAAHFRVQCK